MENRTIQAGWGYHIEFRGNLTGEFQRAPADIPVTIERVLDVNSVIVRLPNGKRGLADIRSLRAS